MLTAATIARLRELQREQESNAARASLSAPKRRSGSARASRLSELPEGMECANDAGVHWRHIRPIEELWRGADRFARRGEGFLHRVRENCEAMHPDLSALCRCFPDGTMFLDLETCGFAGAMIFLVGVIRWDVEGECLVLDQMLARNYPEEKAILASLWSLAAEQRMLVTFNGKSFDWPCVRDRLVLHRLAKLKSPAGNHDEADTPIDPSLIPLGIDLESPIHCDLLHHSRRRWRDGLPNCKLQTLERHICGRRRSDDIPGSQIPHAYHQFVRSGDAWEMRSVLKHNALDLVTLLQLAVHVVE